MSPQLNISFVQEDLIWEDPAANHALLGQYYVNNNAWFDLLILPEMFSSGFTRDFTESKPYPSLLWMKEMAAQNRSCVFGSVAVSEERGAFNRGFWVTPSGEVSTYDKRHLFSYGKEHLTFQPGNQPQRASVAEWHVRPLICYDLRFPVWSRNVKPHYDLLVYVASWPASRRTAWKVLLQARAIENQCYVVGVNRLGTDGYGLTYAGDSCVIDFEGKVLLDTTNQKGRFDISLSLETLHEYRKKFPFLDDGDEWTFTPPIG